MVLMSGRGSKISYSWLSISSLTLFCWDREQAIVGLVSMNSSVSVGIAVSTLGSLLHQKERKSER